MREWINRRFGIDINEETLNEIKNFTLLWNIFESEIFNNSFSINQLANVIRGKSLNFVEFHEIFAYFQSRYIENGVTNNRFGFLNFRPRDREVLVSDALLENNVSGNDKILAIGIIVYRFRNNLFHGMKDFRFLNNQIENFSQANRYLQIILDQ